MRGLNRRKFCRLAIGIGCGVGLGAVGLGRRPWAADGVQRVTRAGWALGADVSITALHADRQTADRAVAAAFAELEQVERLMSLYRPNSQLSTLNRQGVVEAPHPYLVEILAKASAVSRQSSGAFDVTVQPLWEVYADAHKIGGLPTPQAVAKARDKADWRRVRVSAEQIRLQGDGVAVTLNGIAQGFAADKALAALRRHGIEHALVDTGEIGSLGDKGDGESWRAGIQHPRQPEAYLALTKLAGRCLSTSGDYATGFTEDYRENHLFDPRTGRSPEAFSSVSVLASTAWEADALSTAIFVLGAEKGLQLVRTMPATDAFLVFKDGRTLATAGFPLLEA